MTTVGLVEGILLFFGVLYMRRQIKAIGGVIVNEKLIIIHLVNFIVWFILFAVQNFLAMKLKAISEGRKRMTCNGSRLPCPLRS